jgi:hypothetical protein
MADASIVRPEEILPADAANEEDLLRVHGPDYVHRFLQGLLSAAEMRRIGFPYFMELRNGGPDAPERMRGEKRGGRCMSRPGAPAGRKGLIVRLSGAPKPFGQQPVDV